MLGRGVDQILPYPSDPTLHESCVKNAEEYVRLAVEKNGVIPKPVAFSYVWGDALAWFERWSPDVRIINLETSITMSEDYWRDKSIHYRMNPLNVQCLTAAKIDCCALANNHVMDWGITGLMETVATLSKAGIKSCGAGGNILEAEEPAVFDVKRNCRVLVFSVGSKSSGIPSDWAALKDRAGVNLITDLSDEGIHNLAEEVAENKRDGDVVVVSIHWGGNWGYDIPLEQRSFAHRLIDQAGVDVVYGHSSHHVKGLEVYRKKLILYGCGDFLNDYEGIVPFSRSRRQFIVKLKSSRLGRRMLDKSASILLPKKAFRSDLCLMYFARVDAESGVCLSLDMVPMQIRRFRICRASQDDVKWMRRLLGREQKGTMVGINVKEKGLLPLLAGGNCHSLIVTLRSDESGHRINYFG